MATRQRALDIISGRDTSALGSVARAGLSVLSPAYGFATTARACAFSLGLKRQLPLGRPAVSVGNLTTGGTGKTPMVQCLARQLAEQGHRPCVLLRGYRGGDEAKEHKQVLGDLAVVRPNPDRVAEAASVLTEHPEVSCFVLDDGFQHRRAARDLDLVLLDATNPWGFGRLLPRGLLREPRSALRRADGIILTRVDQVEPDTIEPLRQEVERIAGRPPIAHATHAWTGLLDQNDQHLPVQWLADQTVMGIAAIGNPGAFADTLGQHAKAVVHCEARPDHHGYTPGELHHLAALAATAGASAIVTTQKDWVKWQPMLEDRPWVHASSQAMAVVRPQLSIRFKQGEQALAQLLIERIGMPKA
ncbi:MAG: tetraacyldisaccharide 4'-kinase [Planctomycetota bacterium]